MSSAFIGDVLLRASRHFQVSPSDTLTINEAKLPTFAETISGTLSNNTTILSFKPPATAGRYIVGGVMTSTSGTNTGTVQMTVDFHDSQGTVHTGDIFPLMKADGTIVQTGTAASLDWNALPMEITVDNSATAIVIKLVVSGTVNATVAAFVAQVF